MEFFEASAFTSLLPRYLKDDEYKDFQVWLAENPESGDLIPGTGGFRKLRWADVRRNKGRRGGLRIIYYYFKLQHQVWLMALYDKNQASDLTTSQKKSMKAAIEYEVKMRTTAGKVSPRRLRRIH